jgi:hypothetical protein
MSENKSGIQTLGDINYTPDDLQAPSRPSLILSKFPGADNPLVAKFLPDLLDPNKKKGALSWFWQITQHKHSIGVGKDGKPIVRSHPCQKSLGHKECPECDKYYELKDLLKSVGEATEEGKKLKASMDLLTPSVKGWIYLITPDANVIKAVRLPKDLINKIFGRAKTKWKEEVVGLISKMRADGMSPFDLKSSIGWLRMWKEGELFDTKYFVEVEQRELVEKNEQGRAIGKRTVFVDHDIDPAFIANYDISQLPNFREIEAKAAFTPEESAAFAENPFVTPARLLDQESETPPEEEGEGGGSTEATLGALSQAIQAPAATVTSNATLNDVDSVL